MPFLDLDRTARRQRRQQRRQKLAEGLARFAGIFTGVMFGTSWFGPALFWLVVLGGLAALLKFKQ